MLLSKYPSTLRKPSAPLSQLRTEQLRQQLQSPLSLLSISQEKQFVGSNTKPYFVDNMLTATSGYISTAYSSQTNTTLTASSLTNKAADKVDRENTKSENCVFDDEESARFRKQLVSDYPLLGGSSTSSSTSNVPGKYLSRVFTKGNRMLNPNT